MIPSEVTDALNEAREYTGRVSGLLIAMRAIWDNLDGVSDETEALRALIDCARTELEGADVCIANAFVVGAGEQPAG